MEPTYRILIVDDERNARCALAEILRDEGYAVESASDGDEALPKLDHFHPDLVLTDMRMPRMNGVDLMKRIQEREPHPEVILMSAHEPSPKAAASSTAFLQKPIVLDQLMNVVELSQARRLNHNR